MTTPELIKFIREASNKRMGPEEIRAKLKQNGWKDSDIDEGFAGAWMYGQDTYPPSQDASAKETQISPQQMDAPAVPSQKSLSKEDNGVKDKSEMSAENLINKNVNQPAENVQHEGEKSNYGGSMGADMSTDQNTAGGVAKNTAINKMSINSEHNDISTTQDKKMSKLSLAVSVVLGILVLGSGAFAFYYYVVPHPDRILAEAFLNQSFIKSGQYSLEAKLNLTPSNTAPNKALNSSSPSSYFTLSVNQPWEFDFSDTGSFDSSSSTNPKADISLNLSSKSNADSFSVGTNIRILENVIYLELTSLSLPKAYRVFIHDTSMFQNRWLSINGKKFENNSSLPSRSIGLQGPPSSSDLSKTSRFMQKTYENFSKNKFVVVIKSLDNEKIKDVDSYHYELGIDKSKAGAFFSQFIQDVASTYPEYQIKHSDIATSKKDFDDLLNVLVENKVLSTDIWISTDKHLITKITLKGDMNESTANKINDILNKISQQTQQSPVSILPLFNGDETFSVTQTSWGQNQPVTILMPVGATPLDPLFNSFFQAPITHYPTAR